MENLDNIQIFFTKTDRSLNANSLKMVQLAPLKELKI